MEMEQQVGSGGTDSPEPGYLLLRVHVPELNVHKCLQFPTTQLVWDVKQQCLAALPKELKESFNYGLFCPPSNGKAGKFLDEERRLHDYPFNGPVGYLELKYKRRVYKELKIDEKALKAVHTRTNLRRFLDYVTNNQVEKVSKMCSKGLDPNFHCQDTGETPLCMAASLKAPGRMLMALVNGGALVDYRSREGYTPLHAAVLRDSVEAVTTLLELGSSPNYKDAKGLTPLYWAVTHPTDPLIAESLLHDRANLGTQDLQGWHEVHQACRMGLVQHLEQLLYYGADMNARNASGNTPLHVCAVNAQDSCARLLLFRGALKDALNFANQTPYQVAVIAGNMDLAELIQNHSPDNVVLYRGIPRYNPRRRRSCLIENNIATLRSPPSPCPSDRSKLTDDSASTVTDKSLGDGSDVISDSSGVGTSASDTTPLPGTTVVCIENYSSSQPGHLRISQGDYIEVVGSRDGGLLEGCLRGSDEPGLFPSHCVREAPPTIPQATASIRRNSVRPSSDIKHFATAPRNKKQAGEGYRTVVLHRGRRGFGFVLRGAKATSPQVELPPRCPALQYLDDVDERGVADLAGLKKGDFLVAINGEDVSLASHEHVVELIRKSGDLVKMTVISPGMASHPGGQAQSLPPDPHHYATLPRKPLSNTSTLGRSAPLPPRRDPKTTLTVGRARARSMVVTNVEEDSGGGGKSSSAESLHQPRTASIRARPTSSRITAAELEELFARQTGQPANIIQGNFSQPSSPARTPRVYTSVAEMKRNKSGKIYANGGGRVRFSTVVVGTGELHRDFHSTPDLANWIANKTPRPTRSTEELRPAPPPPDHPPPPPPPQASQIVKLEVKESQYSSTTPVAAPPSAPQQQPIPNGTDTIKSSFKPSNNAKLYASPEDIQSVAYRSRASQQQSRPQVRKSASLRCTSFRPGSGSSPYAQPVVGGPPSIPDPDYSLSEGESEPPPPREGSGNSSTSSGSIALSADEIQRVKGQLRASKSYPQDFLDGDNSSSGVSSDQEVMEGGPANRVVSLARLPPPPEDSLVAPPSDFTAPPLIAPPPQFSDTKLVTRVRIVASTPKNSQ